MRERLVNQPVLSWIIRIAGTGIFSWIILRSLDVPAILQQIRNLKLWMYGILCLLYLVQQFVMALRWKLLLRMIGLSGSIFELYKIVLYGQLLNRVLPSSIGGDSAKIVYAVYQHPEEKTESVSAALMDRMVGLFALCFIVLITLPFVNIISWQEKLGGLVVFGLINIVTALLVLGQLNWIVERMMSWKIFQNKFGKYIQRLWDIFLKYRSQKTGLLLAFFISILAKMIMIISQYLTFTAIGVNIPLLVMFLVIPLVNLVTIIPISIGGLGLREASLATLLEIANDQVVSYSLVRYSIIIVITLLLGLILNLPRLFSQGNDLPDHR